MGSRVFHSEKVKSSLLKKYISYYYFDSDSSQNSKHRIGYYPNTENSLTIYKNAELEFTQNYSIAKSTQEIPYCHYYGGILKQFRVADMMAPFDKIGVVFKPYGINVFLNNPLMYYIPRYESLRFQYFEEKMKSTLDILYLTKSIDEKVEILEAFFLSQIKTEQDPLVVKVLDCIESSFQKIKVSKLSHQLGVNPKTLNRKFQKHLCCSVKDYIEIDQFRKSFNQSIGLFCF